MSLPLVSIGVPTYNRAALLAQTLEMIRAQDYPNLEVTISDNHSEDETERVGRAAAAADPRFRYHRQARNIGLHANLNFCLDQAHGDFACLFMDDDQYLPSIISEYVSFLADHPDVGIVCSDWDLVDEDGRKFGFREHRVPSVVNGLDYIDRTIRSGQSAIGCPGTMIRRSALGDVRFEPGGPIGFGDFLVWFQVAARAQVGHLHRRLWRLRLHRRALSCRPIHEIAEDYERNVLRFCQIYATAHPAQVARTEWWRIAMRRYLFWAVVYELVLETSSPSADAVDVARHRTVFEIFRHVLTPAERDRAWTLLRRHRRGLGQAAACAVLDRMLRLRLTWPLVWATRHSESFRAILGLR